MRECFEFNDDVVDVLQGKIDSICEYRGTDTETQSLFDIDASWGSLEHQTLTVQIGRELLRIWADLDVGVNMKSLPHTINEFYDRLGHKGLRKQVFADDEEAPMSYLELQLLQFLVTEIELTALTTKRREKKVLSRNIPPSSNVSVQQQQQTHRDRVAFQLDKICRQLHIDTSALASTEQIVQQVIAAIKTLSQSHAHCKDIAHLPKLLTNSASTLTAEQLDRLRDIELMYHQDFSIRRSMLLKRLEVTLNSFLESNQTTGNSSGGALHSTDPQSDKEKLTAAIIAQQQCLEIAPQPYSIVDAFAAPLALALEQTKKITGSQHSHTTSLAKQIIIGQVPDRGGRVSDNRISSRSDFGRNGNQKFSRGKGQANAKKRTNVESSVPMAAVAMSTTVSSGPGTSSAAHVQSSVLSNSTTSDNKPKSKSKSKTNDSSKQSTNQDTSGNLIKPVSANVIEAAPSRRIVVVEPNPSLPTPPPPPSSSSSSSTAQTIKSNNKQSKKPKK